MDGPKVAKYWSEVTVHKKSQEYFYNFSSIVVHFIHLESMVACTHCARKNPSKVTCIHLNSLQSYSTLISTRHSAD